MLIPVHQIEQYQGTNVPIFISEYGHGNTMKFPRKFNETKALYSPKMTDLFSGGCVYELWQGPNAFGLALLEHKNPSNKRNRAKPGRIAETRENDSGTLLLFEDFFNYKAMLASVAEVPTGVDDGPTARREAAEAPSLASEGFDGMTVPESCVDWSTIEKELNGGIHDVAD
jgi:hypothetical protein